jgi:hypothetical protein
MNWLLADLPKWDGVRRLSAFCDLRLVSEASALHQRQQVREWLSGLLQGGHSSSVKSEFAAEVMGVPLVKT